MFTEQDNKVHFDKSDLIVPVDPSPFWTMPKIIMVNPEVQLIGEKCDNEKMHKQVKLID
jgi:hypothetical protein